MQTFSLSLCINLGLDFAKRSGLVSAWWRWNALVLALRSGAGFWSKSPDCLWLGYFGNALDVLQPLTGSFVRSDQS